jgi:PTS system nitrogen regulatory IIA component
MTTVDNDGKRVRIRDTMPDLLTTKQLAEYLQISERSVYRMLERGEIPAVKVGAQWRFRQSAVDEWLDLQLQRMGTAELDEAFGAVLTEGTPAIADLLSVQNIFLDLPGGTRDAVLGALVERLQLPEPVDRELLRHRLIEREVICTTSLPDGVAVPHTPRSRPRMLKHHDLVAVGRTLSPVDFGALDGKPTDIFVLVLARNERAHLMLVARVSRLVREESILKVLRAARTPEDVRDAIVAGERLLFDATPPRLS